MLLTEGQRPRDTDKESACAQNPEALTAKGDGGLGERGNRRDCAGHAAPRGWGNDIFQGNEALEKGFFVERGVGVGGDLGF